MNRFFQLASLFCLLLPAFAQAQTRHLASWQGNNQFTGTDTFAQGIGLGSYAFASLPAPPSTGVGTIVYCSNCVIANPCASAGSGTFARYEGAGVWDCGGGGGGGGGATISINGTSSSGVNFNATDPSVDSGYTAATWKYNSGTGGVIAEVPNAIQTFASGAPSAGNYVPRATDYGSVGIQQVGSGTMGFTCNSTGFCTFGNSTTWLHVAQAGSNGGIEIADLQSGQTQDIRMDAAIGTLISSTLRVLIQVPFLGDPEGSFEVSPTQIQWVLLNNSGGTANQTTMTTTSTIFTNPITVPTNGCTGCIADPFQFNSSLPSGLLASVVGKSGLRFGPSSEGGHLYAVFNGVTTSDPWGEVVVATQSGASGNINSAGTIDQVPVYISTGVAQFFTLPNGAIKYSTGAGGFSQAAAADLSNGVSGTGQVCLQTNCTLVTPTLGVFSATSGTFNGSGATQLDMSYSGTAATSPTSGHSYMAVDSSNALEFSSNGGNYFHPGPSSSVLSSMCGGSLGTANGTAYIFFPAQQSTTTCTASTLGATNAEVPFPAAGTIQNLFCVSTANGSTGDTIKVYVNNAASTLSATMGTSASGHDITHQVSVSQGDAWSVRYLTNAANDANTGLRCSFEYVRTP